MQDIKVITGDNEDIIWQQVTAELKKDMGIQQYEVVLEQQQQKVLLKIDIDPGGGFESGYELTALYAPLQKVPAFHFVLHPEGLLEEVGKFFGMQDVVLGYPEFDKKVIVKTNNEAGTKAVFADPYIRKVLSSLPDYTLQLQEATDEKEAFLQLEIEQGITDVARLREVYRFFTSVLAKVDV